MKTNTPLDATAVAALGIVLNAAQHRGGPVPLTYTELALLLQSAGHAGVHRRNLGPLLARMSELAQGLAETEGLPLPPPPLAALVVSQTTKRPSGDGQWYGAAYWNYLRERGLPDLADFIAGLSPADHHRLILDQIGRYPFHRMREALARAGL